jgi:hypothetical protein
MEAIGKRESLRDSKLHRLLVYYVLAGLFFLVSLASAVMVHKYSDSLADTVDKLLSLKVSLIKIKAAAGDVKRSTAFLKAAVPARFFDDPPERSILVGLDAVRIRMKGDEVTTSELLYKENEVNLPVMIRGNLRDYSNLVNNVGYLQAMRFPFFSIMSLSIKKTGELEGQEVSYEIKGELKVPGRTVTPESTTVQKSGVS